MNQVRNYFRILFSHYLSPGRDPLHTSWVPDRVVLSKGPSLREKNCKSEGWPVQTKTEHREIWEVRWIGCRKTGRFKLLESIDFLPAVDEILILDYMFYFDQVVAWSTNCIILTVSYRGGFFKFNTVIILPVSYDLD